MKKLSLITMLAIAALSFQSCGGGKDSKEAADSTNASKDSSTMAATDTAGVTGAHGIAVDENDAKFATAAANGGMAEVAVGQLAGEKAMNAKVKAFASMMVTDHSKVNEELMAIAKAKNITLPSAPDEEHQKKKADLAAKTGADFDKAYVDAMIDGHKKTISLFEDAAKNCKDADLKAFAEKTLQTIKGHLTEIEGIKKGMK